MSAEHRSASTAFALVVFLSATLTALLPADTDAQPAPAGGFIETAASTAVRPVLTPAQINALVPDRGTFDFPAPYLTEGVRLTNATDCLGGQDCVNYIGYSYWRNINNHAGSNTMYVFLTLDRPRGGGGPTLFSYDKISGVVAKVGPLFDPSSGLSWATGEGWYFSATQPHALYLNEGPALKRYDVVARTMQTVFDVSTQPGLFGTNRYVWQLHSSSDDRVHSATLRDGSSYAELGCVAYREDTNQFYYFPRIGAYDECQIDKSGRWLVIKENVDGVNGEDNRIIDLETGTETLLLDQNGAGGHSDTGYGYMVASDNWANQGNTMKVWKFGQTPLQGTIVYHTATWAAEAPNHVSHANSNGTQPPEQQYACGSGANVQNSTRANEILCFPLDGSLRVLVVAPVMTDLNAPGGGDTYSKLPKGNLDVTGEYFIWTSNLGGNRLDAFIVRVPSQLLTGEITPPPPPDTTAPLLSVVTASSVTATDATITWITNEAADTQVEYGPSTAYGMTTLVNANLVANHAQVLGGLAAGTLHHFRVKSRDAAGNLATSGDFTFTTQPGNVSTGPVAHWDFDEGAGTTAGDVSGNGRTGTLVNGPAWTAGRLNGGLTFNGATQFVSAAHDSALNAYPLTVAVWLKTDATVGVLGIVNKYVAGSWNGWNLFLNDGNICAWYLRDASNYVYDGGGCTLSTAGLADNAWHLVVYVVDAAGGRLYVDGQQRGSVGWTGSAGAPTTTQDVHVAHYPGAFGGAEYFFGGLDDVRIYDRALSAADVSALYASAPVTDAMPPSVALTSPTSGSSVSGTITVTASASDDVGVAGVQFMLDGVTLGTEDTVAPYAAAWNTVTAMNGLHALYAVARDAATNTTTAATVAVTVVNDVSAPIISLVTPTNVTIAGATVTWTTNEAADTQLEYGLTTAYGLTSALNVSLVTSHSQALSGLAAATLYHFRVKSRDAAGNLATSGDFTFATLLSTAGLVAHWKFDAGAGTTAVDSSGNGRTGTLVNGPAWTAGRVNGGLTFNGTSQYMTVANASALNAYPLTVAVWIKTNATTGVRGIVNKYVAGSMNGWNLFLNNGNICAWYLRSSSRYVYDGGGCTLSAAGFADNAWHQVVYVVDAAGGRLYVDGQQRASRGWTGTPGAATTTQGVRVAHYPGAFGGAAYMSGGIDDVRVYNRALGAAEIAALFAGAP